MKASMDRRGFLTRLGLAAAGTGLTGRAWAMSRPAAAPRAGKPNVILVMTDDQGYGDVACHGNPYIQTPVQDRLSAEGCRFERFYVCPVCAPTRAGLMTGRYHLRSGVHGVTKGEETMRADEVTIADALKAAGYATGMFGKWHLGEYWPYAPHARGFDRFVGFRLGHWSEYFDTRLERNGKEFRAKGYITDFLTDEALGFIEANRDRPFFCYLPYNPPHMPWQVPDRYWRMYKDIEGLDPQAACAYAMVTNIDDNLARVLAKLDELKIADNTIVLFLTDNGANSDRYNAGMKGRKGSVNEGGVRVPLFVRWPGRIKPGTSVDRIAANVDLFPTIVDMCGVKMPKTKPQDGKSLWPLISGKVSAKDWPDRMLFFARKHKGAVRTQQYRMVAGVGKNRKPYAALHDITADPGEKVNLAKDKPEIARKLHEAYTTWRAQVDKECGYTPPPIHVGFDEENPVTLSGPRAHFHEGLAYKATMGYSNDYITAWTSAKAWAHWEIDVVRAGTYSVALRYRCPKGDEGAKIEVAVGNSRTTGTIVRPFFKPPGPQRDVIKRSAVEVIDVEWALQPLGKLTLKKGRAQLTVKALTQPGQTIMDLEGVVLKRLT